MPVTKQHFMEVMNCKEVGMGDLSGHHTDGDGNDFLPPCVIDNQGVHLQIKESKLEITAIIDSVGIWKNGNFGIKTMDRELYSTNRDIEKYQALDFQRGDTVSLKYTVNGQWKNIDSVERVMSSDESAPSGIVMSESSGIPVKDDLPTSLEPPTQPAPSPRPQPTLSGKVDTNERIARSVALKAAVEMVALLDHKGSEEYLEKQLDAWYSKFLEKLTW